MKLQRRGKKFHQKQTQSVYAGGHVRPSFVLEPLPALFNSLDASLIIPGGAGQFSLESRDKHLGKLRICKQDNRSIVTSLLHTAAVEMEPECDFFLLCFWQLQEKHTARGSSSDVEGCVCVCGYRGDAHKYSTCFSLNEVLIKT